MTAASEEEVEPGSYGDELAAIHHSDFGWAATGASHLLEEALAERGIHAGTIVDLGCGSGILARLMTEAGFDVVGVDQSEAMVELARREAPAATFTVSSVLDFDIPDCVAVTAIGEVLQYEFDGPRSLDDLARVARNAFAALRPGGVFLFDLSGPGRGGETGTIERVHDRPGYTMHFRAREDAAEGRLYRDHIVTTNGRSVEERHLLKLFDPIDVERTLVEAGFTVSLPGGYPGGPGLVGWQVFLAGKP